MAKSFVAFAVLTPVMVVLAGTAAASETRCTRGDDAVRRVEIAVQDPNADVPCEVVYWKDTEQPGVRSVLWSAQTDAAFCARKAEELVDTLASGGWSCEAAGEQPGSARRDAPPAATPSPQEAAPSPQAAAPGPQAAPPSPPPEAAPDPAAGGAEPGVAADRPAPAPSSQGASREDGPSLRAALAPHQDSAGPDDAGPDDAAPADTPAQTALDAIIEQNLTRLNDGVEGRFAAEIARYGDLDGDGRDDGLVFFTYESQRLGQARFVAAYLFDGDSYALAATKPLAGSDDNVHSAEIESIEDGVISLRLNILEPGDANCCPSGLRRQDLVLRGGQLIEARTASSAQSRS
jgi:hypothetical protein